MRASTSSCERGICHVVVMLLDSTGINTCTGSVTGLVLGEPRKRADDEPPAAVAGGDKSTGVGRGGSKEDAAPGVEH